MVSTLPPRVVIVTRETEYELLLARHATREAVRFQLAARGQDLEPVEARHKAQVEAVQKVRATLPRNWRQASARRSELDRFLFAEGDVIAAVGQDGLIANVAKYLDSQPVVGVNPDPAIIDGFLARISPDDAAEALSAAAASKARVERRTMVEARLDTGETLLALNEIFVGHRSHQSAVYDIRIGENAERQSSSGVIVSSGTGASGWARSIMNAIHWEAEINPCLPEAIFFVREAWPSHSTSTQRLVGRVEGGAPLEVTSRMEGGVVFADGIEKDFLRFDWGMGVAVRPADRTLSLVVG